MAKSNEKKRDFFWLSYSDLMTSLFFVMLVLFVLVYTMERNKGKIWGNCFVIYLEIIFLLQSEILFMKINDQLFL